MTKGILFILLMQLSTFIAISSFAQSWQWGRSASCSTGNLPSSGGHGSEGLLVTTDYLNYIYIAGFNFGDSICLGNYIFRNPYYTDFGYQYIIGKYDLSGNLLWAKAPSFGECQPLAITTDPSGNLYLYGTFSTDSIGFDAQFETNPLYNSSMPWINSCYFLAKFDVSGNVIWLKSGTTLASTASSFVYGGVATDLGSNIYITGSYSDATIQIGTYTLTNAGGDDIFVAKYDESGNVIWAKSFGGDGQDDVYGIAVSKDDKVYLTGNYGSSTISLGSTILSYSGSHPTSGGTFNDVFLTSLDTSGNPTWAKNSFGNADVFNIAIDFQNNIYVG